ncbi:MAG: zinc ABC transporter substrate-binding protein, partial [Victivallales bacterium]|nr:zinc ABC transporter substrate-binding protein [Victivallales bacterium]
MIRNNLIVLLLLGVVAMAEPIRIVTTTSDLASIAKSVAGNMATVESIAGGREDPHDLTARPSFITRASKADLWIRVGLELEIGWEPAVLRDSRNRRIQVGSHGHLDCSEGILPLDIPTGHFTRADGDVHPLGNPHYWLDPLNGRIMAKSIATRLGQLYPEHKAAFAANLKAFEERLDARMFGKSLVEKVSGAKLWWLCENGQLEDYLAQNHLAADEGSWLAMFMPHKGAWVATYHRSWTYLLKRFRLELAGEIEPKPGVPPSARH